MQTIIAAVRAVIAAIATILWVPCRITGRLIRKMVPGSAARVPAAPVQRSVQRPSNDNGVGQASKPTGTELSVKALAQKMASGSVTMEDMDVVDTAVLKWLSGLDHIQLCRLICAEDLAGYMNRRVEIRGLPRYLEHTPRPSERRTDEPCPDHRPAAIAAVAI